jgi:hypothetical protein
MSQDNVPGEILPAQDAPRPKYVPSPRKDAIRSRLRKFKRHRQKWLAARADSFSGQTYADLLEAGRAHPYELTGGDRHELEAVVSPRAVQLLQHVRACELGFGGHKGGARMKHAHAARILRCSERAAGAAMRELQALGLVEARWHFVMLSTDQGIIDAARAGHAHAHKHREREACYVTTARARELWCRRDARIARKNQVGKKFQPGRAHRTLRVRVKGEPGRGRPVRSFVADVKRARQAATAPPPVATVIERLSDGRVALGSPMRFGVGRLANARDLGPTPRAREQAFDALAARDPVAAYASLAPDLWASFDARENGGDRS